MNFTIMFIFVLSLFVFCIIAGTVLAFVLTGINPFRDYRFRRKKSNIVKGH